MFPWTSQPCHHPGVTDRDRTIAEAVANLGRVRDLIASFDRHDVDACLAGVAAGAAFARGDGDVLEGKDELAARLRDLLTAVPDARLESRQVVPFGRETVLVEWTLHGTHLGPFSPSDRDHALPATGRPVSFVGADLLTFNAAGEIESSQSRVATATFLAQIGVAPAWPVTPTALRDFAERYTAAWCRHDPVGVASCYAEGGSLGINGGAPAIGREAIAAVAEGFMAAFPDLEVLMDDLHLREDRAVYCWTLKGTNNGPGGTGKWVDISGFEVWQLGSDGLIANSRGYFDSAAYNRQLERGAKR